MGTSSAKAVVFTERGELVGEGRARTPWVTMSYGVELAAEELLKAAGATEMVSPTGDCSIDRSRRSSPGMTAATVTKSRRCAATSLQPRSQRQPASHSADSGPSPNIVGCFATCL